MRFLPHALCCTVVLGTVACGEDPHRAQSRTYLMAMRPVLYENSLLAEQILVQGAAVHDGRATPETLLAAWNNDIIPMTQHVTVLAEHVEAPEFLAEEHRGLIDLWTRRFDAYHSVSEGLHTADLDLFSSAQKDAATVTLEEDEWVRGLNAKLAPMELFVDLVP